MHRRYPTFNFVQDLNGNKNGKFMVLNAKLNRIFNLAASKTSIFLIKYIQF